MSSSKRGIFRRRRKIPLTGTGDDPHQWPVPVSRRLA
jgi:hypothetical protein